MYLKLAPLKLLTTFENLSSIIKPINHQEEQTAKTVSSERGHSVRGVISRGHVRQLIALLTLLCSRPEKENN